MRISTLLVATVCLLISYVHSDSCKTCTANYDCSSGFYCCNGQCAPWPQIGEACPCSQCPSGLGCIEGRCLFNGANCSCNTVADCTLTSGQGLIPSCVDNKCQMVSSQPPFSYFTPGGPCGNGCQTNYCNSNNQCDFNPVGGECTYSVYCQPGSGCFDNICQPFKSFGEECQYPMQCLGNYVCRSTSSGQPAICTTKATAGQYCTENADCDRVACKNNVCTPPARGEACYAGECGPEDSCGYDYTCIAKNSLAVGELCTNSVQCQSSVCNGQCVPISTLGGFCNVSAQCPDGHCLGNTCYRVSLYGEACNSTHACADPERPCRNGVCPRYYTPLGELCTTDLECAIGRCSNGVCDYPSTCEVTADCGKFLVCDCGECTFSPLESYSLFYPFFIGENQMLMARSPERDCIANKVVNSACESILAKYYCNLACFSSSYAPNAAASSVHVDCATLTVYSLNVTRQPCCSADSQTDCADTISNCLTFKENQIRPFITRPSAPTATPQAPTSAPVSEPNSPPMSAPVGGPTSAPTSAPTTAPVTAPQAAAPLSAPTSSSSPTATPLATPTSASCNCAEPTPLCDQQLAACVGLRVAPVVQCVEFADNEYTAYMTYINEQSSSVSMSDAINFLNVVVQDKVSQFEAGRPFTYPQSAFNVITTSAQQVSWYLDGFKLVFDIEAAELRCPQDVTFEMTSSAALDQLLAISDSLVGNLSEVMQVTLARLNVTFTASAKRQTSSVITVAVKADQGSSQTSAQLVLEFVDTGFETFISRVPAAAVVSVNTIPPANERTGTAAVTPTNQPSVPVSAPTERGVINTGTVVFVNSALLGFALFVLI